MSLIFEHVWSIKFRLECQIAGGRNECRRGIYIFLATNEVCVGVGVAGRVLREGERGVERQPEHAVVAAPLRAQQLRQGAAVRTQVPLPEHAQDALHMVKYLFHFLTFLSKRTLRGGF